MSDTKPYPWILTAGGHKFHFGAHDPSEFSLMDIAKALSRLCRFNGHLSDRYADSTYAVGQHSVYVYRALQQRVKALEAEGRWDEADTVRQALRWALLHDGIEAYWGDVVKPLKTLLPDYQQLENDSEAAFIERYDIPMSDDIREWVKWADYQMLLAEAKELTDVPPEMWDSGPKPAFTLQGLDPDFYCWGPKKATDEFLSACLEVGILPN